MVDTSYRNATVNKSTRQPGAPYKGRCWLLQLPMPALLDHIDCVFLGRSEEQVSGITAPSHVARMADIHTVRNLTVRRKAPCYPVSTVKLPVHSNEAVAGSVIASGPRSVRSAVGYGYGSYRFSSKTDPGLP